MTAVHDRNEDARAPARLRVGGEELGGRMQHEPRENLLIFRADPDTGSDPGYLFLKQCDIYLDFFFLDIFQGIIKVVDLKINNQIACIWECEQWRSK